MFHQKKKTNQKNQKVNNFTPNKNGGVKESMRDLDASQVIICGKHPSFSAILKKRRKIYQIYSSDNSYPELEKFLKENSLEKLLPVIKRVDNETIENFAGKGQLHQGIVLIAAKLPIKTQNDLLGELYEIPEGEKLPTLLLLDQISDPHNVGAIIRSAIAFGVTKIIFCEHHAPKENSTIIKTAAGTIENADLIVVTNFNNLMEKLKKIGYWCIGLAGEGKSYITEIKDYKNIALVIGSEGSGLRQLVKSNCDLLVKIQIDSEVESLNASVASALALYEISKNHV